MSPTLSGSFALRRVKVGDALKISNGIIFDFYPGLAHMQYRKKVMQQNSGRGESWMNGDGL